MALIPGARLGPYEILSLLGRGGMGEVYKALDTRLDRTVAIKVLKQTDAAKTTPKILKEARAVARLNHPNIAALYDVVEGDSGPFLVMEYVDGELLDALAARGDCDVDRAMGITIQLLDALAYAHREGVIHRDVKPANAALTRDGQVKLLDLGIAQTLVIDSEAQTMTAPEVPTGTARGGTPAYMAPERLAGRAASARSDIYSVGVLLYELLTGRRPFEAKDLLELVVAVASGDAPHVSTLRPGIPLALDAIVARALARDPAERYASAVAFRDDLVHVQNAVSEHATPLDVTPPPAPVTQTSWLPIGLVAATVVIAALGAWMMFGRPRATMSGGPVQIAILPAGNASEDPEIESLGASLVSALTDNLAAMPGVTIVSSNPGTYRAAGRDVTKAAAELGTGYLVDLKLHKSGGRVSVEGQLVHAGENAPVWRGRYEGDPLEIDRYVTDHVASALESQGVFRPRLTADARKQARRLPTADAGAFAAYLSGRVVLDAARDRASLQRAVTHFEDAVSRDGTFAMAYAGLAQAWAAIHQYATAAERAGVIARAADAAKHALDLDPARALVQAAVAKTDQVSSHLEDAERHAREAARLAPDDDSAHRVLAAVLFARHDLPGAIAEARAAVHLRPTFFNNQYALGYYCYSAGRYQDAIPPLLRATELQPNGANNFIMLGAAYHRAGDIQQAIGNYAQAVRLGGDAKAYSNLGTAYYAAGQFDDALVNYQTAIQLNPSSSTTHRNVADTFERLRRAADARREYVEAIARADAELKTNPANPQAVLALKGYCEAKIGRINEALQDVAAAVTLSRRKDNDVMFKSAVIEALAGHTDRALQDLEDALKLGYPVTFARDDWDLRTLRDTPKFKELVNQKTP